MYLDIAFERYLPANPKLSFWKRLLPRKVHKNRREMTKEVNGALNQTRREQVCALMPTAISLNSGHHLHRISNLVEKMHW